MNKERLIEAIYKSVPQHYDAGLNKTQIEACLATLADVTMDELKYGGGEVVLPGLGMLSAVRRPRRAGRNLPPRRTAKFIPSRLLIERLDSCA